jgi:hypothetical protein
VIGTVHVAVPPLGAVDDPFVPIADGGRVHPGRVASVVGFCEAERDLSVAGDYRLDHLLLVLVPELEKQVHEGEVADDRRLLLDDVV